MATRRPSITTPCVANRYHVPGQRIAEFSAPNGKGGLISILQHEDGTVRVAVYRLDEGIVVDVHR